MDQELTVAELSVRELVRYTEEERANFLLERGAGQDAFGLELFRRAVCERDDEAWAALIEQYRGMVLSTIHRNAAATWLGEDDVYWVNRAFQRFWFAVGPERIGQFKELGAILGYLKMCAASVLVDEMRARRCARSVSIEEADPDSVTSADHCDLVSGRLQAAALWAAVCAALHDDTERLIARLSFVSGLSPREIFARHAEQFETVNDVYRIKRNVVERLRRDPQIARARV